MIKLLMIEKSVAYEFTLQLSYKASERSNIAGVATVQRLKNVETFLQCGGSVTEGYKVRRAFKDDGPLHLSTLWLTG